MKRKKNQAPSTHGPGVLTEGAQKSRLEGSSIEEPPSKNEGPGITAQAEGKFNPDIWREQRQETPNPSHGYDPVLREGLDASDKISGSDATEDDYTLKNKLKKVIDSNELITSQKIILAVLILKSKDDLYCELTYDEIASLTALSRRNVATHIPLLEKEGWIKKTKKSKTYIYEFLK